MLPGRRLAGAFFALFLVLSLATPGWRTGPFTWWPILSLPMLAGRGASFGLLSILPFLTGAAWFYGRRDEKRRWHWGPRSLTWPLAILSLLVLSSLKPAASWRTVTLLGAIGLAWFVYLFVLNERPRLTGPIALVIAIQASVALGQFWLQRDLGLIAWGELPLDPLVEGVSVLQARGRPWLRAHGLTAHPNALGAMLTILLITLLPRWRRTGAPWRWLLGLTLATGLVGLVVTFSRSAWLGFAVGMIVCLWQWRLAPWRFGSRPLRAATTLLLLPAVLLLIVNADLVASRFLALETPTEARSLRERIDEVQNVAPALIAQRPFRGVGAGNYVAAAQPLRPAAVVAHNVTLLVMAELGVFGAVAWLWLAVAGVRAGWHARQAAPWIAMLVISLFDNSLWLTASWRGAMLFGLLLANVVAEGAGSRQT